MVAVLNFIRDKLEEIGIPYEYGEWTAAVTYPYFVGTFDETEHRYEDNYTAGTLTIDGWARGKAAKETLLLFSDRIRRTFADLTGVTESSWEWDPFNLTAAAVDIGHALHVRSGGCQSVPSGEQDLFRVQITLYTQEWEGD